MTSRIRSAYDIRIADGRSGPRSGRRPPVIEAMERLERICRAKTGAACSAAGPRCGASTSGARPGRGKSMLMDLFFRHARAAKAARPLPRLHGPHPRPGPPVARGRQEAASGRLRDPQGRRPDRADRGPDRVGGPAALLRRASGHRHRRRHDPGPAVRRPVREEGGAGRHLQPRARPSSTRTASTASSSPPSSTRSERAAWSSDRRRARLAAEPADGLAASGSPPATPTASPARRSRPCGPTCKGGEPEEPAHLQVLGRDVVIERTAGSLARATFDELCARPLGPQDYLAIAARFHTLFLEAVPDPGAPTGARRRNGW
jgi:cell division protein ZapE